MVSIYVYKNNILHGEELSDGLSKL